MILIALWRSTYYVFKLYSTRITQISKSKSYMWYYNYILLHSKCLCVCVNFWYRLYIRRLTMGLLHWITNCHLVFIFRNDRLKIHSIYMYTNIIVSQSKIRKNVMKLKFKSYFLLILVEWFPHIYVLCTTFKNLY